MAVTVKVADWPMLTVWLVGCVVMEGNEPPFPEEEAELELDPFGELLAPARPVQPERMEVTSRITKRTRKSSHFRSLGPAGSFRAG